MLRIDQLRVRRADLTKQRTKKSASNRKKIAKPRKKQRKHNRYKKKNKPPGRIKASKRRKQLKPNK